MSEYTKMLVQKNKRRKKMRRMVAIGIGCVLVGVVTGIAVHTVRNIQTERKRIVSVMETVAELNVSIEEEVAQRKVWEQHVRENNIAYAEQMEILARCVEAEAGNQDIDVKRAVVAVIMNRVDDDEWPDTISEVIRDPYEFASYWNGRMDEVTPSVETYEAIRLEMDTRSYPGLYYFDMDKYLVYGTPYKKMGDLYFSTK